MNLVADAMGGYYTDTLGRSLWTYNEGDGSYSFELTGGAANGPCLHMLGGTSSYRLVRFVTNTHPDLYMGGHVSIDGFPDMTRAFSSGLYSGHDLQGDIFRVGFTAVGSFVLTRGADDNYLDQTASGLLLKDVINKIEFHVHLHEATGSWEVRLNGQVIHSASGLATCPSSSRRIIQGWGPMGQGFGGTTRHSNVYLNDGSGSHNNGYEGVCFILTQLPIAEGIQTQWDPSTGTVHYSLVNSVPPDITKWNSTSTLNKIETYRFGSLPAGVQNISLAQIISYVKKSGAGARALTGYAVSPSNIANNALLSEKYLADGYQFITSPFNVEPISGDPLTPTNLVANDYGVKVTV